MRTDVLVLLALLLGGAATADEGSSPSTRELGAAETAPAAPLRLPPRESFRLFQQAQAEPRIEVEGMEERRLFHQSGDPDSLFTIGRPSADGDVHLLAVIDVNELFLKAIAPDPLVSPTDTRPRAAGSFLPVDSQGRPYQLRLGARLVW